MTYQLTTIVEGRIPVYHRLDLQFKELPNFDWNLYESYWNENNFSLGPYVCLFW